MRCHWVGLLLVVITAPLSAQALTTDIGIRSIGTPQVTLADRIDAALELPLRTVEMREAGVPDDAIRDVLDMMQVRNIPTAEQLDILSAERDAVRDGKPHAGFASFVQRRLDAGVRGTSLVREIHPARLRQGPDSMASVEAGYVDPQPEVSQLPNPAHARRPGSRSAHHATWGRRP